MLELASPMHFEELERILRRRRLSFGYMYDLVRVREFSGKLLIAFGSCTHVDGESFRFPMLSAGSVLDFTDKGCPRQEGFVPLEAGDRILVWRKRKAPKV